MIALRASKAGPFYSRATLSHLCLAKLASDALHHTPNCRAVQLGLPFVFPCNYHFHVELHLFKGSASGYGGSQARVTRSSSSEEPFSAKTIRGEASKLAL